MKFMVFQLVDCYVLATEPPCLLAQARIGGAHCVGHLDATQVGEMVAAMLEAAVEGDGFFSIGLNAAHILFRSAGGIRAFNEASAG
ncbi:MAG: hypothetical protein ABW178_05560 [Pseudoxanthomonas sp.]